MAWEDEGKGERKNILLLMVRVTNVLLQVRIRTLSAWFLLKFISLVYSDCINCITPLSDTIKRVYISSAVQCVPHPTGIQHFVGTPGTL